MNAQPLFEALQAIPDHRTKKGRRFELATILIIALAAMLSGANDLLAIARWGKHPAKAAGGAWLGRLALWLLLASGFPVPGQQCAKLLGGMIGDAGQDVGKRCLGIDV